MKLLSVLAALLLAFLPCIAVAELPRNVRDMLRDAAIPESAMSALVVRLSDGKVLLEHEADRARQPASTLKILTSLVALDRLGPAWRGRTEMRRQGEIVDSVLKGDLVLRGMADVDFDWQAFEQMLQVLRLQGVREVRGDFVLDLTFFNPTRADIGVAAFDQWPEFRYNMIPDALMLNSNLVRLDMHSDGTAMRVAITPPLDRVSVVSSEMQLVERRCADWEDGWMLPVTERTADGAIRIKLQGNYPPNCTANTSIGVIDRLVLADRTFRALWKRLGGTFRGKTVEGRMAPDARLVASHTSRTLAELTRDVVKRSDNPITRVLYLAVGAASNAGADEPTARRADREVRDWLAQRGIDSTGIVLENGSGLSRLERISPRQLVDVLKAAITSDWAPEFMASLPIVATDGGMRNRLKDKPPASRGRIKTGTLRDTTAVAGYIRDEAGESYAVAAVVNDPLATSSVARPIVDGVLDWVARSPAP